MMLLCISLFLSPVFFGFIITGSGSTWSAKGTSEEAKAIEGAGDSYAAIIKVGVSYLFLGISFICCYFF